MPQRIAMREKDFGIWQEMSWADYWDRIQLVGHALLDLGIEPGDRIAIHSENRRSGCSPTWARWRSGRPAWASTPPTRRPRSQYLLSNSGAKVLVAEDQEQVDKALSVIGELPDLRHIVYLEPRGIQVATTTRR